MKHVLQYRASSIKPPINRKELGGPFLLKNGTSGLPAPRAISKKVTWRPFLPTKKWDFSDQFSIKIGTNLKKKGLLFLNFLCIERQLRKLNFSSTKLFFFTNEVLETKKK